MRKTQNKMEENQAIKARTEITGLEIGKTAVFPIEKTKSIRAQASELGLILDRVYKTRTSRSTRTITVTRMR